MNENDENSEIKHKTEQELKKQGTLFMTKEEEEISKFGRGWQNVPRTVTNQTVAHKEISGGTRVLIA